MVIAEWKEEEEEEEEEEGVEGVEGKEEEMAFIGQDEELVVFRS